MESKGNEVLMHRLEDSDIPEHLQDHFRNLALGSLDLSVRIVFFQANKDAGNLGIGKFQTVALTTNLPA